MFIIGQSNFLQALGWAVLNSLWQMALLWVIYQLATALFSKAKCSQKSLLATTLLFAGFVWFVFTFFVIVASGSWANTGYSSYIIVSSNQHVNDWLYKMLPIASIVYLVLFIAPVLNFIRNYRYVQLIRRYGLGKADVQWKIFVQKVAAQMGITKPVPVWMSDLIVSPVTIGYVKPIILLPVAAVTHLSTQQVEAVLLHELSHIKRLDYLINLIIKIIQSLLYFNPFVKAFSKIIEREREKNCDEIVLQFQYEPHGYASALLALEKAAHPSHFLTVAAAGGKKDDLLTRIESIMGIPKKPVFSFTKLAGIVAALLFFISLNVLLALSKPGESNSSIGLLTDMSGPFHFFILPGKVIREINPANDNPIEGKSVSIVNYSSPATKAVLKKNASVVTPKTVKPPAAISIQPVDNLFFTNVNFSEDIIPELDEQQEEQVKEALTASKKVMTEDQWKTVENNIADAMTSYEKAKLKVEYKKAIGKLDWEKMEDKLRVAYDKIDWNLINNQLNTALVEIKWDSLQQVYTTAIASLSSIEKELKQTNQCGIPDSGITLKSILQQKKEAQKAINTIKSVRSRKIVHL